VVRVDDHLSNMKGLLVFFFVNLRPICPPVEGPSDGIEILDGLLKGIVVIIELQQNVEQDSPHPHELLWKDRYFRFAMCPR
jgi:hypothetical protein